LNLTSLKNKILNVTADSFELVALEVFRYQYNHVTVYRDWVDLMKVNPKEVTSIRDIPFLPISAFKTYKISDSQNSPEIIFESSGTTLSTTSKHLVHDLAFYNQVSKSIFESFYGDLKDYCILALLPSYLERNNSSLVYMVDHFIIVSKHEQSGFYLDNFEALHKQLIRNKKNIVKTLLIGVSFALLDFIEEYSIEFKDLIVMETGGMKGRRKELPREELHKILQKGFGVNAIHSEYGMTELLSQSYSKGNGLFFPGNTIKILTKEITDPLQTTSIGSSGVINIIDLANVQSCAFIETSDLGKVYNDGSFEILGRIDYSDIRGCNLMVSDL